MFSAVVPGRSAGDDRNVFSYAMPVRELSPGQYYLRASLSSGTDVVKRVARAFRVEPAPAVAAAGIAAAQPRAPSPSPSRTKSLLVDSVGKTSLVPTRVQGFREHAAARRESRL